MKNKSIQSDYINFCSNVPNDIDYEPNDIEMYLMTYKCT